MFASIVLRSHARKLGILTVFAASVLVLSGAPEVQAQVNAGCSGSPNADCADVGPDGVRYTSGVTTVNVGDGVPGPTVVDPGTIGIQLSRSGVNGATAPDAEFTTIKWDTDNDPDTPEVDVVSMDGTTPYLSDGNYVTVATYDADQNPETFTIGTGDDAVTYTGTELAQHLAASEPGGGAAISGSLTVNNNAGAASQGAPFGTTNAAGIVVSSTGGNGGSGHCHTIIFLYTWCHDGSRGGDAGSVAVNSNSTIVVNGDAVEKHGIMAVSQGGTGGNGGGFVGLVSEAGGGGNGGNSSLVSVMLGANSNITTHGDKGDGVYALSRGGNGGSGGHASAGFALGSDGGNGGDAGDVLVVNQGSILTTGWNAHGIYASSVGAGAGSGSKASGIYAEGGNGGGESDGGAVTVNNGGIVTTQQSDSFGILAQSIGGGGGDGGGAGGWFTVGGRGGSGGGSDVVTVFDSGKVWTGGDRSTAIFAQSIGGGGGNGGDAVSVSAAVSVAVGGSGGPGGKGDEVHVTAQGGDIKTVGNSSPGIQAQSIGGGGGNGGLAVAGTLTTGGGLNVSVALGGSGGSGGDAGGLVDVETDSATTIGTLGSASYGIMAQSIGGGGGNGGMAFAGSGGPGLSVAVGIGGKGGGGGSGKNVSIDNAGTIATAGDLSAGIFTQSIGGGGGNGGFAGSLAVGGTSVAVSVGGAGGSGGAAGQIGVVNSGAIATAGESAAGIFAQSIGGGGGNGGSAFAGSVGVASVTTSVGGKGGAGNDGNRVDITNSGLIATQGNNSAGVFAQSVGGGGGSGGDATSLSLAGPVAVAVAVGGDGGSGGNGGQVTVDNQGRIAAAGPNSDGVFAQSVGGSGGAGGSATTGTVVFPIEVEGVEIPAISVNVAVGGRGGGGGTANTVTVSNSGQIDTADFMSNGVFAQSVGGSGGKGGHATNISLSYDATFTGKVAVGGSGGQGGIGNAVTVDNGNGGVIHTQGDFSNGVFAQSVGGGGGAGGNATNFSLSLTPPPTAPEDFIPSPSGNFDLAIGGNGGNGAIGGEVAVTNNGSIRTDGMFAAGVMAQSVGGSGGSGGDARSIQVELTADPMDFVPLTSLTSLDMTMVFGGTGGSGSHGGNVTVTNESSVTTTGAFSHGIVAQSVGGGGGNGGSAMIFQFSNANAVPEVPVLDDISGLTNLSMTLQGSGGAGGNGGDVTLDSTGSVSTSGDFAMGVVAQSVGGGGGLAGFYNPQGVTHNEIVDSIFNTYVDTEAGYSFAGSVGGDGTAGHVVVNHTGSIVTRGDGAHGLFAQSAAGQGSAGSVDVTLNGSITASGKDAHGIYAQSGGGGGNGNIAIAINEGTVSGGSGTGAGVVFSGGADNSLVNHGTITSVPGVQGRAIFADTGNESIDNYGAVTGAVELGAGANAFHNESAGTLNSGTTLGLGAAGVLTNEGTFSPGGSGTILATALAGNMLQTPSGTYLVDLNLHTNAADRTSVSGSAGLAGRVQVASHDPELAAPGEHRVTILSSAGGVTSSGLSLSNPTSAIVQYQLLYPDPTSVVLGYGVNFSPPGLNGNQGTIGNYLSNVQSAGGFPGLGPIVGALVAMPDAQSLASGYDRLSPEPHLGAASGTLFSSIGFSDAMHSCGVPGGANRFVRQGECDWFRLIGGEANQERTASNMGSDRWSLSLSTGAQRAVGDGSWHAGWGFAYEYSILRADDVSNTSGDQLQFGAIAKKEYGATSIAADLSVGYGGYFSDRFVNLPVPNVTAHSTQDVKFLSGHLRLARAFERGASWYLKPMVDLGATHSWFSAFRESGAGAANLDVASRSETYVVLTPALEIGGETRLSNGRLLRPYAKLGVTHFVSGASPEITASFQGAPVGVAPFTVKGEMDKTYANVHLGVTLLNRKGQVLQVGYFGSFSDHLKSNSGMVKLSIPF